MDITQFITVTVISILAVVSPGPDFIIVTRNSLLHSKRVGLFTALGITAGTMVWIALSIIGVSYLISEMVVLFNVLKWAGALYLMYLGVKSFRSMGKMPSEMEYGSEAEGDRIKLTSLSAFNIGLLTNLLNPKAALFFVSFFSVILTPETPFVVRVLYGLENTLIACVWFSLLATVLSFGVVRRVFQRFGVWFERITGGILIALGIKLAVTESK